MFAIRSIVQSFPELPFAHKRARGEWIKDLLILESFNARDN